MACSRRRLALLALAVLFAAVPLTLHGRSQRVSFRTEDGATIAATWYEPAVRPAPAVILIHMLQRSRHDWDGFASRLASAGIGALAIDLRAHGESSSSGTGADTPDYSIMIQDVRAARRFLATRSDVRQSRVGIAGASLGANLAALEAAGDGTIASLALLSPSTDYRGLRIEAAVRKYANRPMLLIVSDDDAYARRSAAELQKAGGGTREIMTLAGAGHGTNMLARASELPQALIDWFRRTLE